MTEQLHVVHVVLSLDVGGLERNVINQIREGEKLGQRVSVVCVERPGILAPKAESLGARVICLEKRPGFRLGVIGRMRTALRALAPDVVHTHQIGPLFYTGPAAVGLGIPLIVHTEHGKVDYAGRRRMRWLGRLAGRFAARFYCLTSDMAEAVITQRIVPREKVRVIQNGIDTDFYRIRHDPAAVRRSLGIPSDAFIIGTVGRLHEIKRQEVLIRSFARLRARVAGVHLLLVGDGPRRAELGDLAARLGLRESVHFAGYQDPTAPYLQAMNCFALTSRSEGMPQSVLEASVVGLPVIASRVGGLPEVIDHGRTGMLFEAGDEEALEEGLWQLLSDREQARRMGEAGCDLVSARFSIRRMAGEYHRDFLELLGWRVQGTRVPSNSAVAPLAPASAES